jgi:hypothetical protein
MMSGHCLYVHCLTARTCAETGLGRIEAANMMLSYQVNAMGPILVCKAMAPLLVAAEKLAGASDDRPAVIANMSAKVQSMLAACHCHEDVQLCTG